MTRQTCPPCAAGQHDTCTDPDCACWAPVSEETRR